jgi:uncharacterized SAM-binding protein YcdF (DUF218 family)
MALIVTLIIWNLLFCAFLWNAVLYNDKYEAFCENIVVLTGERHRIPHAIRLIKNTSPRNIFISGVYKKTSVKDILDDKKTNGVNVILGKQAKNTQENASEINKWVRSNEIKEIVLITSDYHMYRSTFELQKVNPKLKIHCCAVKSEFGFNFARKCIKELHKTLYIRLRSFFDNF